MTAEPDSPAAAPAEPTREQRAGRRVAAARRWGAVALVATAAATAGLAASLYFFQYRPDRPTDPAAARTVIDAAEDGTSAVLSYSPDTVDHDLAAAKTHLTGPFLEYYTEFTGRIMAAAVKQRQVQASVEVLQAGVSAVDSHSAVVLLFINQTTTSNDRPYPARTGSSVRVTLEKVRGSWLISQLEPE